MVIALVDISQILMYIVNIFTLSLSQFISLIAFYKILIVFTRILIW